MIQAFKTGLTAMGAIASLSLATAPITGAMSAEPSMDYSGVKIYEADLDQLNGSGAHGTAIIIAKGSDALVAIQSYGLSTNLPHAQHIHLGTMPGSCPSPSADKDGDGLISVTEAAPNYGPIKVSLTTSGDYSPASALAVDRFPVTSGDGVTTYVREFTLPDGVTAESLKNGEIVQHGISSLFDNKAMYDGSKLSDLTPTLPFEATVPADCGVFKDITPMVMADSQYPVMFENSLMGAVDNLHMTLGMNETVTGAFATAYDSATQMFASDLMDASSTYAAMMMSNPGAARDHYVDAFNHAKADYFNRLEVARNDVVNKLSGVNDVAKDAFVNAFNQARDMYGNQLESIKNQF